MQTIKEGAAKVKVGRNVFYNPKMGKLRDISVAFLKSLGLKEAKLLDATAATGVRGIRYALEAGAKEVTMLDINSAAYKNALANVKLNRIKARVMGKSLQEFAASAQEAFDVIDLDPFGSPVPLVNDALRLSHDGSVLMVTATDTATLCGAEGSACIRIYGARPMHNELCHESGVRILIGFIAKQAAQYNFGVEPLLGIADMHYMRIFLRLRRGAKIAAESAGNSGFVAYCGKCHNFSCKKGVAAQVSTKCTYCKAQMRVFGPMWLGNLKDAGLASKMAGLSADYPEETGRLVAALGSELDVPFFYSIPKTTSYLRSGSVPIKSVIDALQKSHKVSRTHFDKDAIKTNASIDAVIGAVRSAKKISRR